MNQNKDYSKIFNRIVASKRDQAVESYRQKPTEFPSILDLRNGRQEGKEPIAKGHYSAVYKIFNNNKSLVVKCPKPETASADEVEKELSMLLHVHKASRPGHLEFAEYNNFIVQVEGVIIPDNKNEKVDWAKFTFQKGPMIVMPYHKHGGLDSYLKSRCPVVDYDSIRSDQTFQKSPKSVRNWWMNENKETYHNSYRSKGSFGLRYKDAIRFCLQAAKAVKFLKLRNVIHMDIAARNFLMVGDGPDGNPENMIIRLTDFGLAKLGNKGQNQQDGNDGYNDAYTKIAGENGAPGNFLYQSIEILTASKRMENYLKKENSASNDYANLNVAEKEIFEVTVDHKSDIWALGIVFWEIFTYCKYPNIYEREINNFNEIFKKDAQGKAKFKVKEFLENKGRLAKGTCDWPDDIYLQMLRCWGETGKGLSEKEKIKNNFVGRVSTTQLIETFEQMLQECRKSECKKIREKIRERITYTDATYESLVKVENICDDCDYYLYLSTSKILDEVIRPSDPKDEAPLYINEGDWWDVGNFSYTKSKNDALFYTLENVLYVLVMAILLLCIVFLPGREGVSTWYHSLIGKN